MCSSDLPVLFRRVFALTSSLVDPRATYMIPLIIVEVFLGTSNSEWRMYVEGMPSGVAGIKDPSARNPREAEDLHISSIADCEESGGKSQYFHATTGGRKQSANVISDCWL